MSLSSASASEPRISVVVPTYGRPHLLARLVAALEAQSLPYDDFELLVVDNGSTDDTTAVLEALAAATPVHLRPLRIEANRGPAGARNLGWRMAKAPLVAFTDDDCVPSPDWLRWGAANLDADERIGVVQGATRKPPGEHAYTRWTSYREVLEPSPWFEGCNLFFRKEALEATGGFDESIHFGGEDSVAGWSVLAAGYTRAFDEAALVHHDLDERGVRWHMTMGWREGDLLGVAARFPDLQRTGFWRPWALRPLNVAFAGGVAATVAAAGARRPGLAALGWLPWFAMRRPPLRTPHFVRYVGERWAVDAAVFAGMKVGAVRHRRACL